VSALLVRTSSTVGCDPCAGRRLLAGANAGFLGARYGTGPSAAYLSRSRRLRCRATEARSSALSVAHDEQRIEILHRTEWTWRAPNSRTSQDSTDMVSKLTASIALCDAPVIAHSTCPACQFIRCGLQISVTYCATAEIVLRCAGSSSSCPLTSATAGKRNTRKTSPAQIMGVAAFRPHISM
jgi:hypothetical protein